MNFYYENDVVNRQRRIYPARNIHTPPCNVIISEPPKQEYERTHDNDFENHNCPFIREQNPSDGITLDFVAKSRGKVECTGKVEKR